MITVNESLSHAITDTPQLNQYWVLVYSKDDTLLKTLTPKEIFSNSKINKTCSSNNSLEVGGCYAGELSLSIVAEAYRENPIVFNRYNKLRVRQYFWYEGIDEEDYRKTTEGRDSTDNFVELGTYHINSVTSNDYKADIQAYDLMYVLDEKLTDSDNEYFRTHSLKPEDILEYVCDKIRKNGYNPVIPVQKYPTTNKDTTFKLSEDSSFETWREVVSEVAFLMGGFAYVTTEDWGLTYGDVIYIGQYKGTSETTGLTHKSIFNYSVDIEPSKVGKFMGTCCGFTYEYKSTASGTNVDLYTDESKFMRGEMPYNGNQLNTKVKTAYDNIRALYVGKTFRGCEFEVTTFPIVVLGDNLTITRVYVRKGIETRETISNILVTEIEHTFNGRTTIVSPSIDHTELNDNYKSGSSPKTKSDGSGEPQFDNFVDGITGVHYVEVVKHCPVTVNKSHNLILFKKEYDPPITMCSLQHGTDPYEDAWFKENIPKLYNTLSVDYSSVAGKQIVRTDIDLTNVKVNVKEESLLTANYKSGDIFYKYSDTYYVKSVVPYNNGIPVDISMDWGNKGICDISGCTVTGKTGRAEYSTINFVTDNPYNRGEYEVMSTLPLCETTVKAQMGINGSKMETYNSYYVSRSGQIDTIDIRMLPKFPTGLSIMSGTGYFKPSDGICNITYEGKPVEDSTNCGVWDNNLGVFVEPQASSSVVYYHSYSFNTLEYMHREELINVPLYAEVTVLEEMSYDSDLSGAIERINETAELVPIVNSMSDDVAKLSKTVASVSGNVTLNSIQIDTNTEDIQKVSTNLANNVENTKVNADNIATILSDYLTSLDLNTVMGRIQAIEDYIGLVDLIISLTDVMYYSEDGKLLNNANLRNEELNIYFTSAGFYNKLKFMWDSNKDNTLFTLAYKVRGTGSEYAVTAYQNITTKETDFDVAFGSSTSYLYSNDGYYRQYYIKGTYGSQSAVSEPINIALAPDIKRNSFTATRSGDVVTVTLSLSGGFPALKDLVPNSIPINPEFKFKAKYSLSTSSSTSSTKYKVIDEDYVWDKLTFQFSFEENKPSASATSYYLHVRYGDGIIYSSTYVQVK